MEKDTKPIEKIIKLIAKTGLFFAHADGVYEKEHFPIEVPSLAETMNARLEENQWSQKEMASILGITAPRLSAILSGKAHPTFEQARTIASRLNIDPSIVLAL